MNDYNQSTDRSIELFTVHKRNLKEKLSRKKIFRSKTNQQVKKKKVEWARCYLFLTLTKRKQFDEMTDFFSPLTPRAVGTEFSEPDSPATLAIVCKLSAPLFVSCPERRKINQHGSTFNALTLWLFLPTIPRTLAVHDGGWWVPNVHL